MNMPNNNGFKIEVNSKEELDQVLNRLGYYQMPTGNNNCGCVQPPVVNVSVNPVINTTSSYSETNSLAKLAQLAAAIIPAIL